MASDSYAFFDQTAVEDATQMAAKGPNNLMRSRIVMPTLAFVAIGFGPVPCALLYMQVFRQRLFMCSRRQHCRRGTRWSRPTAARSYANIQVLAS